MLKNKNSRSLLKPERLYITITHECNLKCKYCTYWTRKNDPAKALSLDQKINLLEQFKNLNPQGQVFLYGGEPLLNIEEFIVLNQKCRELKLYTASSTNGCLISNEKIAEKIIRNCPDLMAFSIDSAEASIHNTLRGNAQAFQQAIQGVKLLLAARAKEKLAPAPIIYLAIIISDENYTGLNDFIEFARELQVDGIFFQPMVWVNNVGLPKNKYKFQTIIDSIIQKYHNDPFVMTNLTDLFFIKEYQHAEAGLVTKENICRSYEKNLMIDLYGNVGLCHQNYPFANVQEKSLAEIWQSAEAEAERNILRECRYKCGMLSNVNSWTETVSNHYH